MEMTSIIADQPTTRLPEATAQAVADINARIDGLNRVAAFLAANADLPGNPALKPSGVFVALLTQANPKAAVSTWMLRAIDAGAEVEAYSSPHQSGVRLHFGTAFIQAYAWNDQMGETVEVTRSEWRLGIEIPAHARRESAGGAS